MLERFTMKSTFSRIFLISIFAALCLSACEDSYPNSSAKHRTEPLDVTTSPILSGSEDNEDSAVIGLFEVTEKNDNGDIKGFIFYDSNFTGVIGCVFMVNTILKN